MEPKVWDAGQPVSKLSGKQADDGYMVTTIVFPYVVCEPPWPPNMFLVWAVDCWLVDVLTLRLVLTDS
jgi:hypothetical protein